MLPLITVGQYFLYIFQCVIIYRLGRFLLNLFRAVYVYHIAPIFGIGIDFTQYQTKWTVITGCTDGIGEAYLFALAEKGLRKFIMISRSQTKLNDTAARLLAGFQNCQVQTFAFTFGRDDFEKLGEYLSQYKIGILVNNVGDGPRVLQKFAEDYKTDKHVTTINIQPAFELIRMVLPRMKQEKSGVIVNVSSSQSIRPVPLLASYSASKVYLAYLSECLHREYRSDGITVQCLVPLLVATKLIHYESACGGFARYFVVSPDTFAQQAVSSLGVVSYTMGCFSHDVQKSFLYLLPWWILRHLLKPVYKHMQQKSIQIQKKK